MASSLAAFSPTLPHAHLIPHQHRHPAHPNPTTGLFRLIRSRRRTRPRAAVRLAVSASSTSAPPPSADRSEASSLERCLSATVTGEGMGTGSAAPALAPPRAPPAMKGGRKQYGAFGAVTIEKAKLDLSQRRKKIMPETACGA